MRLDTFEGRADFRDLIVLPASGLLALGLLTGIVVNTVTNGIDSPGQDTPPYVFVPECPPELTPTPLPPHAIEVDTNGANIVPAFSLENALGSTAATSVNIITVPADTLQLSMPQC